MIKQAVLFVVSTGVLIYFIAPVDDDKSSQPVVQKASDPKPSNQSASADSWYADSDDEEEPFVFGQPVTYSDDDESDSGNTDEKEREYQSTAGEVTGTSRKRSYAGVTANSGASKSGRPGSKGNPIDLTPPGGRQKR
ncbi:MAG: hypothetical protein ABJP02_05785 [Parasphingorhabdus sp.]|uniref:hypothetical protein n=1 Tax=Parasphingorhabdus sp. TaxID=2709688 RepID=UPI003298B4B9